MNKIRTWASKINKNGNKNAFLCISPTNYGILSQEVYYTLELKAEQGWTSPMNFLNLIHFLVQINTTINLFKKISMSKSKTLDLSLLYNLIKHLIQ